MATPAIAECQSQWMVKMPKMKSSRREATNVDFAERVIMMNHYGGPFC